VWTLGPARLQKKGNGMGGAAGRPPASRLSSRRAVVAGAATGLLAGAGVMAVGGSGKSADAATVATPDWLNVMNYGAAGDGTTDDTAALQQAISAAAPGQVVYLPVGVYSVSYPLSVPNGVIVQGSYSLQQSGNETSSDWGAVLKPTSSFSNSATEYPGSAVFICLTGTARQHFQSFLIDGSASATGVDGIAGYGNSSAVIIDGVGVYAATGNGVGAYQSSSSAFPDGWLLQNVVCQNITGIGFALDSTDLTAVNCHAQTCGGDAWSVYGANSRFIGCRADLSANGFTVDATGGDPGNAFNDSYSFIGCGTQRNRRNGLNIVDAYTGTSPMAANILVTGCSFDGDGINGTSSTSGTAPGGGGYAGIAVNGLNIVHITGSTINAMTIDVTAGAPEWGITTSLSASGSRAPVAVTVDGTTITAVSGPVSDAAPASQFSLGPSVMYRTGAILTTAVDNGPVPSHDWTAKDMGYAAWAYDPAMAGAGLSTRLITAGTLNLIKVNLRNAETVSNVFLGLAGDGATLTSGKCLAGLYSNSGALLGSSADQSSAWGSGAPKMVTIPLTAQSAGSLVLQPGRYYIAILANGGTMPSFESASNVLTGWANGNLSAASARYGTNGSSLTSLPASFTPSSTTLTSVAWWAAIA